MSIHFFRKAFFLLLMFACLIMTACSEQATPSTAETDVQTEMVEMNFASSVDDNGNITWTSPMEVEAMFSGQLTPSKQSLPVETFEETAEGVRFRNEEYILYCDSMMTIQHVDSYHWHVILDGFSAVSETSDGQLVCLPTDAKMTDVLLVCPSETPEYVTCYMKQGSDILDISTYDLDDFSITLNDQPISAKDTEFMIYWQMHTEVNGHSSAYLDGYDRREYHAILRCNATPWLSYRLHYYLLGENGRSVDIRNIYDIPSGALHCHALP